MRKLHRSLRLRFFGRYGVRKTFADDFRSVADDEECFGVELIDELLDFGYFCQLDDGVNDFLFLHRIGSLALQERGTVTDVAHEYLSDDVGVVGDDDNGFSLLQADDDLIRNKGGNINAYEGKDGQF